MSKKTILYIANGNSIHDVKWMTYFSEQTEKYSCYLLCDTLCELSAQTKTTSRLMYVLPGMLNRNSARVRWSPMTRLTPSPVARAVTSAAICVQR